MIYGASIVFRSFPITMCIYCWIETREENKIDSRYDYVDDNGVIF